MKKQYVTFTWLLALCLLVFTGCTAVTTPARVPTTTPVESAPAEVENTPAAEDAADMEETVAEEEDTAPTEEPTATPVPVEDAPVAAESTPTTNSDEAPIASEDVVSALQDRLSAIHEQISPSVVHIRVVERQEIADDPFHDFPFSNPNPDDSPREFFSEGLGSGFVWDKEGHIVTNNHVVAGADRITITFHDGSVAEATLVGADRDSDLAVLKVDEEPERLEPIAVQDSNQVRVGQLVVVLGNPFGLEGTMTVGFVSALGRSLPVQTEEGGPAYSIPDIIQTDASINPGNSGGVMVDEQGRLIGVPSAIRSPVQASVGVGFAIPSAIVEQVVPVLIEEGSYTHSWLGISGRSLTPDMAREMDLPEDQRGALVMEVVTGGPSDQAGVRGSDRQITVDGIPVRVGGDVIVAFDGRPVEEFEDLIAYLARYTSVGDTITLTVLRDGATEEVDITLGERPALETPADIERPEITDNNAWLGIEGQTVTPAVAEAMELDPDISGVLVIQVEANSPADEAGLRGSFKSATVNGEQIRVGGDVITAIDGEPLRDIQDLRSFVLQANPDDEITLTIVRGDEEMEVSLTLDERP